MATSSSILHVALFPFMAKGHTIPLLQLVKLIHKHRSNAMFTIFTTLANEPFISSSLVSLPSDLIDIVSFPFPSDTEIPAGVESTDKLPSISLFYPFVYAVEKLRPAFETAIKGLQSQQHPVTCLVSDAFLYWTHEVVSEFNIPRLAFYGINNYSFVLYTLVSMTRPFLGVESEDESVTIPELPWVRVTRNDFDRPWSQPVPEGPIVEFVAKCGMAISNSYGLLANSFDELESRYVDYWNNNGQPKSWCIGPLCLADDPKSKSFEKPIWEDWLDKKWAEKKPILYVAFGTQAELSNEQLVEIMIGLEKSKIDFLWALRIKPKQEELINGLEERVEGGRGLIVREWVDQRRILEHEATQGYLTHCGWNSITESICAKVPILAWPMMAEQHLNAKLIVEELNVGLRVETCNGSVRGFIKSDGLRNTILELMVEEKGKVIKKNVEELSKVAKMSIEEGGSSWNNLEALLNELELKSKKKDD